MPPLPRPIHASLTLRLLLRRSYSASTTAPVIKVSSIPAPNCGSIRILSLNRPEARNAISKQLLAELAQQVQSIQSEGEHGPTRALILASETDSSFCAGADLKERKSFTPEETTAFLTTLRATFTHLSALPIPTLSAIAAPAFGGGLELALCTSLRVFSSRAVVALPETRLAILPGAGGTYRLPALVGETRARDLILTGRRVGGPEAYFLGLCDRLVEVTEEQAGRGREMVLEEAVRVAREICEGGPIAIQAAMQAVGGWREGERSENRAYERVVRTADRDEALLAFREKRKPVFKGR